MPPLAHAALAIGIAGAGRVALNSAISVGYGSTLFGRYASVVSGIMLVGGLAAAGPQAAITLGVARRFAREPGTLPSAQLRFLLALSAIATAVVLPIGFWTFEEPAALWVGPTIAYAIYQLLRSFGYAVQRSGLVTVCEAGSAVLTLVVMLAVHGLTKLDSPLPLVGVYTIGPASFVLAALLLFRRRLQWTPVPLEAGERRQAIRESTLFFVGAGSSTVMQFLPTVLAGRLDSDTVAAILFGALHASAPLLLLSRVYMTVMMPAAAASDDGPAEAISGHMTLARRLMAPCLALALGGSPWIVLSLGMSINYFTTGTAAMVALMMVFQVWSTPAVTLLSARKRELVPALSSVLGLAIAGAVWWVAADLQNAALLPVGLAFGAVARSLLPAWIASGWEIGRVDLRLLGLIGLVGTICAIALGAVALGPAVALSASAAVGLAGVAGAAAIVRQQKAAR